MNLLVLLALWRAFLIVLLTLFLAPPVIGLSYLDPYAQRAYRLVRLWVRGLLWSCRVRVRVRGREHLDPKQVYLFMANHQSMFDIPAVEAALSDFQLRWVAKKELQRIPVFGRAMQATKQILVDRQSRTQAVSTLRQAKRLLQAGISVLFFPEGTRSPDGCLLPFKPGGFALALEMGIPVVPVTIKGSRDVLPPGDWRVRSGAIEVVLSPPIFVELQAAKKSARGALMAQVRQAIAAQLYPSTLKADPEEVALSSAARNHER